MFYECPQCHSASTLTETSCHHCNKVIINDTTKQIDYYNKLLLRIHENSVIVPKKSVLNTLSPSNYIPVSILESKNCPFCLVLTHKYNNCNHM